MSKVGWLVNDCLTCIPGTTTFWHNLLHWFPNLIDKTNGYTDYSILSFRIENELLSSEYKPYYIIRNGSYFSKIKNIDVKQISLIQDILTGDGLSQQIDIINNSNVVIFNTNYVYQKYINHINSKTLIKICPLGVDFDFFKPIQDIHPDVLPNSIIFIGSSNNYPKGFNVLVEIIKKMENQNFCLIMKDDFNIDSLDLSIKHRVKIFNRINQENVRLVINSCIAAICTSYEETQHLSGIECAACNIPIIAREVGVYYDNKEDSRWGCIADDLTFVEKINYVLENIDNYQPRQCFIEKYSLDICKNNWIKIIDEL
jgi:glycosyltransferase involved in cell wall biosynthesis